MARSLRIQYEGALYHLTCRGNEKKDIFRDDTDREVFLNQLNDSLKTYRAILHCFVLMDNHFHLLLETPLANLSEFMRRFNITYTSHYNKRHKRAGHLYQGRYKSILVDKENYLVILSRYIHLNPVRTKQRQGKALTEQEALLRRYKWSSLLGYVDRAKCLPFIEYGTILEAYGGDTDQGRKTYWMNICGDISKETDIRKKIVGGSVLGSDEFIGRVKEKLVGREMREVPSGKKILNYKAKEAIVKAISEETGKTLGEICAEKGTIRQVAMELLYRVGGLKGIEIGKLMGVDYSTVSQGRKKLKQRIARERNLALLIKRIEQRLSR